MLAASTAIAILMASPPDVCGSTMYGYSSQDINPVSKKAIGWNDGLYGGLTIWHQTHPRKVEGVAHRTLPLGSWVVVQNPVTKEAIPLRVIDRGPFGAIDSDGHWFIKSGANASRLGKFSGCLDITYPAGVKITHRGKQRVLFWRVPRGSQLEQDLNAANGPCPEFKKSAPLWWRLAHARCVRNGRW